MELGPKVPVKKKPHHHANPKKHIGPKTRLGPMVSIPPRPAPIDAGGGERESGTLDAAIAARKGGMAAC